MTDKVVRFTMLVGIPATGKTTVANHIASETDAIILSSDEMRRELFEDVECQDRNSELFEEMNRRAIKFLKMGESVIYDATNLSSRRRRALISQLPREVFKSCIYFSPNMSESVKKDIDRERSVGYNVIDRMFKRIQVPTHFEGWDSIILYPLHHKFSGDKKEFAMPNSYDEYIEFLKENGCEDSIDLAQDNPYHSLSVSRHMYYAYDNACNLPCDNELRLEDIKIACLLHDIGKPNCKEFNGKYASFKGHEFVSARRAVEILKNYKISEARIIRIVTLIQMHMRPHDLKGGSKDKDKFKNMLGEELWQDLITLSNCDSTGK